jgi:L-iditol 2-dehydrogenase
MRCGICGSDVHVYHGASTIKPPVVLGHEFAGTIHALGTDARGFREGDRVAVEPGVQCGECQHCRSGRYNLCLRQEDLPAHDGAYADYACVAAHKLVALPEGMSFAVGAMIEPAACAMHALDAGHISGSDTVLVLGAGTIGLLVAQAARLAGAASVAVSDVIPERLAVAMQLGADAVVNVRETDLGEWVRATYGEGGVSRVFDAVAKPSTFQQSLQLVQRGGRIIVVGVATEPVTFRTNITLLWEIEMTGINMYTRRNFDEAVQAISSGQVQVEPLVSATYGLGAIDQAYDAVLHHPERVLKVHLAPSLG